MDVQTIGLTANLTVFDVRLLGASAPVYPDGIGLVAVSAAISGGFLQRFEVTNEGLRGDDAVDV